MNLEKLFVFGMRQQEPPPVDWTGVLLFKNNMPDVETTRELTKSLRGKRIIAVDCEGGDTVNVPGIALNRPPRQQPHPDDTAFVIGRHLNNLGINTNLAPVADLNSSERSFGQDPWETGTKVRNTVMSYRAANIISCVKHFPGLPSEGDSHHENVFVPYLQLIPFFEAVKVGVPMIMMGHAYSDIDVDNPASRSPATYKSLRESLGFDGVIITDSLEMKGSMSGLSDLYSVVLRAFMCGADIMMISSVVSPDEQLFIFEKFKSAIEGSIRLRAAAQKSIERVDKLLSKI